MLSTPIPNTRHYLRIGALGAAVAIVLITPVALGAESFRSRLEQAHALLREGDVQGAMALYRDLQTDDPESDVLYYNIARVHYDGAMQEAELEAHEDALASLEQAKEAFAKVLHSADPQVRRDAAFNHANCVAQVAKLSATAQKHQETVEAFEQSVAEYEDFLRQHPDHQGARNNLDHMRYLLKSMLQNPPPPQQQQGEGDENQDQEQQDDQGQDQQQEQEGQQQQQDQEEGAGEKQEEQEEQEEQPEQQPQAQEQEESEDSEQSPEDEPPPDDRQNVEAILQSLEDIDEQEQRETRTQPADSRLRNNWW